jgi:hypothetical protein
LPLKTQPLTVVVYVSHDQVFSEPILADFERETGIKVRAIYDTEETKSTGAMNRLNYRSPKLCFFCPPALRIDSDFRLARSTFTKPDFRIMVRSNDNNAIPNPKHEQDL